MAVPQGDFSKLLRELRSAGPVDRVRLLAKSLAALRGLSPWDRKILLRMAGFEGAEVLVERLATEDEATGRKLRRLLHELESRPDELARTVRALSDPKMRGEALDELLATLDRGLGPEPEAASGPEVPASAAGAGAWSAQSPPPPPPPSLGPWSEATADLPPAPEPEPVPVRPSPPPTPPPPTRAAAARAKSKAKPRQAAAAGRQAAPATAPAQPAEPARPEPQRLGREELDLAPEPESETGFEPALAAEPPRAPAVVREAAPGARSGAPGVAGEGPDGPSRTGAGILDRLLELRGRIAADEPLAAGELRRALETEIPFPWARRRALAAWLESGPPDLDEALALIAELEGATGRSWCLGTLAANGPWSEPEWEKIVAAAPTPAARRRLERRR